MWSHIEVMIGTVIINLYLFILMCRFHFTDNMFNKFIYSYV